MSRKVLIGFSAFIILAVLLIFWFAASQPVSAGTEHNLSGYAWSSNIGWISFNCTNDGSCGTANYGVSADASGNLSGYAWSSNIGWISFNSADTTPCPISPCAAFLNPSNGQVNGWARALSNGGGWDGLISLRGSNYGVDAAVGPTCGWSGWAWGSTLVGWISFSGVNYGVTGTGSACATSPPPPPPPPAPQCSDGLDNDGDGFIDYPNDPGCSDALDNDETNPLSQCSDGVDNDGDGKVDFPTDPGCSSATDNNEAGPPKIKEVIP